MLFQTNQGPNHDASQKLFVVDDYSLSNTVTFFFFFSTEKSVFRQYFFIIY